MKFDSMMEELQKEYVAELPEKMKDIKSKWKSQEWDMLRDHFHKLKGTGKTYGVPEISLLGEVVEKICLNSQDKVNETIPVALRLLQDIYESRKNANPFAVEKDPQFSEIKAFAA